MPSISKRSQVINKIVKAGQYYSLPQAITVIKEILEKAPLKFDETVELAVNLGVDPRKSDQAVRGSVVLPQGTGKTKRVAVFTSASHVDEALKAGADMVGLEDLAEKVKAGEINFDIVLASPDAMRVVGQLGQILGPRGLMPNPKDKTVTTDIANAVKNAKMGQARYRTDKAGVVHCAIGKTSFTADALTENLLSILNALKKAKPNSAKGVYFKKITLSTTMGPGLAIDIASLGL